MSACWCASVFASRFPAYIRGELPAQLSKYLRAATNAGPFQSGRGQTVFCHFRTGSAARVYAIVTSGEVESLDKLM